MGTKRNIVRLAKEFVIKIHNMVIARCTDFSMTIDKETIDITSFDSKGFNEFLGGNKNVSITFGSMVTREGTLPTSSAHGATGLGSGTFENLFDHIMGTSSDYPVTVGIGDEIGTAPNSYWEGGGILNSLSIDGSVGDKITLSGSIQMSGEVKEIKASD